MKRNIAMLLALAALLLLCGCRSNYSSSKEATVEYSAEPAYYSDYAYSAYEETNAAAFALCGGAVVQSASDNSAAGGTDSGSDTLNPDKIIYSGSATVETTDFDATIARLEEMVSACGGFFESGSTSDNNYYKKTHGYTGGRSADYTIRVPGSVFGDIMGSMSTLGNVPYSSTYTQNVTSQYYDTQSRLEAYKAQEQRLIELMEKAETIDDIIAVEERLTDVRYSIDSMQSTLINYDRRVSYSTIDLHISEVTEYTPTPTVTLSFGEKLVKAARSGFVSAVDFLEELVLWLAEALPTLVILVVLIILALIPGKKAVRALKARRAARKAARADKKAAPKAESSDNT